jgi:hypothetical protein
MILILGGNENQTIDSVVNYCLLNHIKYLQISEHALINELSVDDRIFENGNAEIRWYFHGHEIRPNTTGGVLNFLELWDSAVWESVHQEDVDYARAEFAAYLSFALAHYPNVINPAWGGSISGYCQSLPLQWTLVRAMGSIHIPEYYFGLASCVPLTLLANPNRVISGDISNGRHWNSNVFANFDGPHLVYERPSGYPVLVTFLDDAAWFHSLSGTSIPEFDRQSVITVGRELCSRFHVRLAEMLVFVSPQYGVTFGSIQPGAAIERLEQASRADFINQLCLTLLSSECAT